VPPKVFLKHLMAFRDGCHIEPAAAVRIAREAGHERHRERRIPSRILEGEQLGVENHMYRPLSHSYTRREPRSAVIDGSKENIKQGRQKAEIDLDWKAEKPQSWATSHPLLASAWTCSVPAV
jgi:hypothetical protein